jgi:hypothetical protein
VTRDGKEDGMRFITAMRTAFLASGFAVLLLAGCGPAPSTSAQANNTPPRGTPPQGTPPGGAPPRGGVFTPAERLKVENELMQIGVAYFNCITSGRPPSRPEDLYPYLEGAQSPPSQGLASGKYVFFWNVGPAQMTEGT